MATLTRRAQAARACNLPQSDRGSLSFSSLPLPAAPGCLDYEGLRSLLLLHPEVARSRDARLALRFAAFGVSLGINWDKLPPDTDRVGNFIARKDRSKVDMLLQKDIDKGWVIPLKSGPFLSKPAHLLLVSGTGKDRLVHDYSSATALGVLTGLNRAIDLDRLPACRLTALREVAHIVTDMFRATGRPPQLAVRDATAYFKQFRMIPSEAKLLRFHWRATHWQFLRMCFGLKSASHIAMVASRTLCSLVEHAVVGVRVVAYIDDFMVISPTPELHQRAVKALESYASTMGIGFNDKAREQEHSLTRVTYLGFVVDSEQQTMQLTEEKRLAYASQVATALKQKETSKASWEQLVGRLQHVSRAHPAACPRLRSLHAVKRLEHRPSQLPEDALEDLLWWQRFLGVPRGASMSKRPSTASAVLHIDASDAGLGIIMSNSSEHTAHKALQLMWSDDLTHMAEQSINCRELVAAAAAIIEFRQELRHQAVIVYIDNVSAEAWLRKASSPSPVAAAVLKVLFDLAAELDIAIWPRRVASEQNKWADVLSRHPCSLITAAPPGIFTGEYSKASSISADLVVHPLAADTITWLSSEGIRQACSATHQHEM